MKSLASIQALRAAAAFGVLAFHACQWSGCDFAVGAAGVDVFFLISGFVLWLSAQRAQPSPAAFLAARLVRVAPLYGLATLAYAAVALLWPAASPEVYPQAAHLLLSLAFIPHFDPAGGPFPLAPSGWTLTYEVFFYLMFAAALAAPQARRFKALAGMLAVTALIGFAYHAWYELLANPLMLEFLAGVALAKAWSRGRVRQDPRTGLCLIGLGLAALALEQVCDVRSDFWRPILFGAPAFAIVSGALAMESAAQRAGLWMRPFLRLGDASYSLYLSHLLVVTAVWSVTPHWPAPARIALTLAAALGAGVLVWVLIERPMIRLLRRRPARALAAASPARA